uniref:Uncharacterized protein n=1 Tax=Chenopodium quinoa TaxID=63459 RepID=A0A803LAP9_CHEQI
MNSQNINYHAGQAKAQTEEKASNLTDKASSAAQSTKESIQEEKASNMADKACCAGQAAKETVKEGGSQMQAKATRAMDSVKEATGMNK